MNEKLAVNFIVSTIVCRNSASLSWRYDEIRYDTIEEINVDSKAEYTA